MDINWALVIELLKAVAWPIVATAALCLFRRPLTDLVSQIARRASKLSVYEVSVELATLPELSPSWSVGAEDVRQLTSSQIFDSASQTLFQELLKPGKADYAVVDLGAGREWLTSRLFAFALVLGNVTKLRAFVFVENTGVVRRRFLGVATPAAIQAALARQYPWLEEAYLRAAAGAYLPQPADAAGTSRFTNQPPLFADTDPWRVTRFVEQFIANLQRTTTPPAQEAESHLELQAGAGRWERAHWINGERLERDMAGHLGFSWYQDSPDAPRRAVGTAVARREGAFVALVDQDRRFIGLIDRYALLDLMGKQQEAGTTPVEESKTS
jgi:hypothetical protein